MATAEARTRVTVTSATLILNGNEAKTLLALLMGVKGSTRVGTVQDCANIREALLKAGVPHTAPLTTIDLGD